jgi:soluble lytic murein transglycosylase-like protein
MRVFLWSLLAISLQGDVWSASVESIWAGRCHRLQRSAQDQDWREVQAAAESLRHLNESRFDEEGWTATLAYCAEQRGDYQEACQWMNALPAVYWDAAFWQFATETALRANLFDEWFRWMADPKKNPGQHDPFFSIAASVLAHLSQESPVSAGKMIQRFSTLRLKAQDQRVVVILRFFQAMASRDSPLAKKWARSFINRWPTHDFSVTLSDWIRQEETQQVPFDNQLEAAYRNRHYSLYRTLYDDLPQPQKSPQYRYWYAQSFFKEGKFQEALDQHLDHLAFMSTDRWYARSLFQMGRLLLQMERDLELLAFLDTLAEDRLSQQWVWELEQLRVLALRRLQREDELRLAWASYQQKNCPSWFENFYWLQRTLVSLSKQHYYEAYAAIRQRPVKELEGHEKREHLFLTGFLQWQCGVPQQAEETLFSLLTEDPNDFFSMLTRTVWRQWSMVLPKWQPQEETASSWAKWLLYRDAHQLSGEPASWGEAAQDRIRHLEARLHQRLAPMLERNFWWQRGIPSLAVNAWSDAILAQEFNSEERLWVWGWLHHQAGNYQRGLLMTHLALKRSQLDLPWEALPREVAIRLFPRAFAGEMSQFGQLNGVHSDFLYALMREESRFDPLAKSSASARGLFQFIPETAQMTWEMLPEGGPSPLWQTPHQWPQWQQSITDHLSQGNWPQGDWLLGSDLARSLYAPASAIQLGATHVQHLIETQDGDLTRVMAAYNAGPEAVQKWESFPRIPGSLGLFLNITYHETRGYCRKVWTSYYVYRTLYGDASPDPFFSHFLP